MEKLRFVDYVYLQILSERIDCAVGATHDGDVDGVGDGDDDEDRDGAPNGNVDNKPNGTNNRLLLQRIARTVSSSISSSAGGGATLHRALHTVA